MAMIRYKVLRAEVKNGEVSLPKKAILLNVLPYQDPVTALPVLAFMMTYADWAVEFPDDVKSEEAREEDTNSVK